MISTNYILENGCQLRKDQFKETLKKIEWGKQHNIIHFSENFRAHSTNWRSIPGSGERWLSAAEWEGDGQFLWGPCSRAWASYAWVGRLRRGCRVSQRAGEAGGRELRRGGRGAQKVGWKGAEVSYFRVGPGCCPRREALPSSFPSRLLNHWALGFRSIECD